jgi:hypothetical protein
MLNSKDERDISYDLMDYFNKRPLKTHLKFESSKYYSLDCPYQDYGGSYDSDEYNSSSSSDSFNYEGSDDSDEEISSSSSDSSNYGEDIGFEGRSDEESD